MNFNSFGLFIRIQQSNCAFNRAIALFEQFESIHPMLALVLAIEAFDRRVVAFVPVLSMTCNAWMKDVRVDAASLV